jgi:hypothetical protein
MQEFIGSKKQYSLSFTLISCLPLAAAFSTIAFYFLSYTHIGRDPNTGNSLPAVSADYSFLHAFGFNTLFFSFLVIALWLGLLLITKVRELKLGWFNVLAFISGWALYVIIYIVAPGYFDWFIY